MSPQQFLSCWISTGLTVSYIRDFSYSDSYLLYYKSSFEVHARNFQSDSHYLSVALRVQDKLECKVLQYHRMEKKREEEDMKEERVLMSGVE